MIQTLTHGWVIEIEGLGRRSGSFASDSQIIRPLALSVLGPTAQPAESRCDVYAPLLVPQSVRVGSSSISPLSSDPIVQTLDFEVILSDEYPEVARFLLGDAEPVARLIPGSTPVQPSDTVLYAETLDGSLLSSAIEADSIVYNRREAWRVDSVVDTTGGQGQINVFDLVPSPFGYFATASADVLRSAEADADLLSNAGHIGTAMAVHEPRPDEDSAPPWPDDRIFTASPFVRGRSVVLYRVAWEYDINGSGIDGLIERLWGRFVIADSPRTSADGLRCTVSCRSWLSEAKDVQLNARPSTLLLSRFVEQETPLYGATGRANLQISSSAGGATGGEPIFKVGTTSFGPGRMYAAASKDGAGLLVTYAPQLETQPVFAITRRSFGARGFAITPDATEVDAPGVAAFDLLISDPLSDLPLDYFDPASHPYYSTARPDPDDPSAFAPGILTHPLHMLLAHLGAIPSNLPRQWIVRLDLQSVDVEGILAVARGRLAFFPTFPGVVAGGDGKPVSALDWLASTFLQPLGWAWSVVPPSGAPSTQFNQLGSRTGQLTIRAVDDGRALEIQMPLGVVMEGRATGLRTESASDSMTAVAGRGLGSAPKLTIYSDQAYNDEFRRGKRTQVSISADGLISADDVSDADALAGHPGVGAMRSYLASLASWTSRGMREFIVTAAIADELDALAYYAEPGAVVVLDLPGSRAATDAALNIATVTPPSLRAYLVLAQTVSDDYSTQVLRLAQLGYEPGRIAPAALIDTVNASTDEFEAVCEPYDTILPDREDSPYQTALYAALDDGETFATVAGDVTAIRVQFADETLEVTSKSSPLLSYDYATNTFTLDQPEEIGSTTPYTPSPGDWVILTYVVGQEYGNLPSARFGL
jgi:hypothetical protein